MASKELPRRKFRFGIRSLMVATAIIAAALFLFSAEREFVSVKSSISSTSPDGTRTITIESKIHKSLFRQFRTVESKVYLNPGEKPTMTCIHPLGPPYTSSTEPANFAELNSTAIAWDADSQTCVYPLTPQEQVVLSFKGDLVPFRIVPRLAQPLSR